MTIDTWNCIDDSAAAAAVSMSSTPDKDDSKAAASEPTKIPQTIGQMQNPVFQMNEAGFKAGAQIRLKKADDASDVAMFTIKSVNNAGVDVQRDGDGEVSTLSADVLFAHYKVFSKKLNTIVEGWRDVDMLNSKTWLIEAHRSLVSSALRCLWQQYYQQLKNIEVLQHPMGVKALKNLKAKELQLVPATLIVRTAAAGKRDSDKDIELQTIDGTDTMIYLCPQCLVPSVAAEKKRNPWVAPYWFVQASNSENHNMEVVWVDVRTTFASSAHTLRAPQAPNVRIPVLQNKKAIKEGDMLTRAIVKIVVSEDAQPKKKAEDDATPMKKDEDAKPKKKAEGGATPIEKDAKRAKR